MTRAIVSQQERNNKFIPQSNKYHSSKVGSYIYVCSSSSKALEKPINIEDVAVHIIYALVDYT